MGQEFVLNKAPRTTNNPENDDRRKCKSIKIELIITAGSWTQVQLELTGMKGAPVQ